MKTLQRVSETSIWTTRLIKMGIIPPLPKKKENQEHRINIKDNFIIFRVHDKPNCVYVLLILHERAMQSFLLSHLIHEGADCVVQLLFRPDPDQRRVQPLLLLTHARLSPAMWIEIIFNLMVFTFLDFECSIMNE